MNHQQFLELSAHDQLELWFEGAMIGSRPAPRGLTIVCKQIEGFYVEYLKDGPIWLDVRTFTDPDLLVPYLDSIDIDGAW